MDGKIELEVDSLTERERMKTRKRYGCGSVDRVVASDTRGLRFESSHWQKIIHIEHLFTVNCVLKRRK